MRRILAFSVLLALVVAVVAVAPAAAGSRVDVTMTVTTIFDDNPDAFVATGIPGCGSGFVSDGNPRAVFTRTHGVFSGYKIFDCGNDNGFVVRLDAKFGPWGSVGS